jgi:hypothetical protein
VAAVPIARVSESVVPFELIQDVVKFYVLVNIIMEL